MVCDALVDLGGLRGRASLSVIGSRTDPASTPPAIDPAFAITVSAGAAFPGSYLIAYALQRGGSSWD